MMKHILILFLSFQILSSCQVFEPKPESEKFYCKIDGKAFRPDNGGDIFFEALLAQWAKRYNQFYFTVYGKKDIISISTVFKRNEDFSAKKYLINEEFSAHVTIETTTINGPNKKETYETYSNSGFITFTKIDTLSRKVSGTFEFKAENEKKTISVTKGQFNDVFYY